MAAFVRDAGQGMEKYQFRRGSLAIAPAACASCRQRATRASHAARMACNRCVNASGARCRSGNGEIPVSSRLSGRQPAAGSSAVARGIWQRATRASHAARMACNRCVNASGNSGASCSRLPTRPVAGHPGGMGGARGPLPARGAGCRGDCQRHLTGGAGPVQVLLSSYCAQRNPSTG
jgi:ribosomal protein S27AE